MAQTPGEWVSFRLITSNNSDSDSNVQSLMAVKSVIIKRMEAIPA